MAVKKAVKNMNMGFLSMDIVDQVNNINTSKTHIHPLADQWDLASHCLVLRCMRIFTHKFCMLLSLQRWMSDFSTYQSGPPLSAFHFL